MIITNCLVVKSTYENELALEPKNIVFSDLVSEWISTRYMVAYIEPIVIGVGVSTAHDTPKELKSWANSITTDAKHVATSVNFSLLNIPFVSTQPVFKQEIATWAEGFDGFMLEGNLK